MSFEVIEHLEENVDAMREWQAYVRPDGYKLLATPGHPSRWTAADVCAWHVGPDINELLLNCIRDAGFAVDTIECYGFPLANLLEHFSARAYGKELDTQSKAGKSAHDLTDESGSDRSAESRFWPLISSNQSVAAMRLACRSLCSFLNTACGSGHLVVARKF